MAHDELYKRRETRVLYFVASLCREELIMAEEVVFDDEACFKASIQRQLISKMQSNVLLDGDQYHISLPEVDPKIGDLFEMLMKDNGELDYGTEMEEHFKNMLDYAMKEKNGVLPKKLKRREDKNDRN